MTLGDLELLKLEFSWHFAWLHRFGRH